MNDREKQILKILRRNPLIQQNEIADILQISRSRVAAHIMDLMRKGLIKGKGYILTEQDYCVVVGAINMDIRGMADIRYPQRSEERRVGKECGSWKWRRYEKRKKRSDKRN